MNKGGAIVYYRKITKGDAFATGSLGLRNNGKKGTVQVEEEKQELLIRLRGYDVTESNKEMIHRGKGSRNRCCT